MDKTLLTIAGAIISVLLAIIGYFLNKHVNVTEALTEAVNSLNITVKLLENSQANIVAASNSEHKIIDNRLDKHSEKLHEHGEAIVELRALAPKQRRNSSRNKDLTNG